MKHERVIVIGGNRDPIPGIRYEERNVNGATWWLPRLPQTDDEVQIVERWLKRAGYPSYAHWATYCRLMREALGGLPSGECIVVVDAAVVDRRLECAPNREHVQRPGFAGVRLFRPAPTKA